MKVFGQLSQNDLDRITVLRQKSCQPQENNQLNQKLTDSTGLSSVDWVLGPVLLAFPLPFAQELDPGTVHQQVQRGGAGPVGQLHPQRLLAPAHGAEVGHAPVQARQAQQALNQTQALTQRQVEQALDAQTELDGCLGEDLLASSLATGRGVPLHVFVQPDRQRPSGFERGVVCGPVGGLVARLGVLGFGHTPSLPARGVCFVQQSRTALQSFVSFTGSRPTSTDETDGLRITLANGAIIHLRPSGNAPELRCYTEANSAEKALHLLSKSLEKIHKILRQ